MSSDMSTVDLFYESEEYMSIDRIANISYKQNIIIRKNTSINNCT